jgi:mRNA interferase RelE/StbE
MPAYQLDTKRSFEKDLRRLPDHVVQRVFKKLDDLVANPFPHGVDKIEDSEHSYRIRVGDYRIVYAVDDAKKRDTFFYARHRKDVYRSL